MSEERVVDSLAELLAIKLHEHSDPSGRWPGTIVSWICLPEADRERYRAMAYGKIPLKVAFSS